MNISKSLVTIALIMGISTATFAQEDATDLGPLPVYPEEYERIDALQNYYFSVEGDRSHRIRFTCQLRRPTPAEMWISGRGDLFMMGNLMVLQPGMREATATWQFKRTRGRDPQGAIFLTPPSDNKIRCFESRRRDW